MSLKFRTRKVVKYCDLNTRDTLFGGRLLEWIDEECGIYAACQMKTSLLLTKYISEINFLSPAYLGEVIEIGVDTVETGRTSLTMRAVVREKLSGRKILQIDRLVFVAVNEAGRPVRHALGVKSRALPHCAVEAQDIKAAHDLIRDCDALSEFA